MEWLRPYLVARVRVAALRAMVEAGGKPAGWQLRRAVEPILGDLLDPPATPAAAATDRRKALKAAAQLEGEAARREALGPGAPRGELFDAVFTGEVVSSVEESEGQTGCPF